ncbi:hypothetical protein CHU98_g12324 [Xylaria longipes]|nr:hypothetical protein CHU98_g12324 [Xylaria longipes]
MEPLNDAQPRIGHRSLEQAPARKRRRLSRPPVRLQCVHTSSEDKSKPRSEMEPIDIFAIHGLDTKSPETWIWKDNPSDSQEPGVNWLSDKCMLPSRVGPSRIFTCDWPAELFESLGFAEHTFEELARLLLEGILGHHEKQRPILFVASCLGGIILMKALNMADGPYLPIKLDTRAILFLSTPFRGTAFQEVAKWAEPGLRVWAWSQGRRVTERLDFAKESAPKVSELIREFTQILKEEHYEVSTFYEMGYTDLRRKIPYLSSLFPSNKRILVDSESGTLEWAAHSLPLDRTHVQMNKFSGPNDPGYGLVASWIERYLKQIREGTSLQRADACILRHYEKEKLKIIRLSGDPLEMGQCYINLAIVEQRKDGAGDTRSQTSPLSLSGRLKTEAPHKGLLVELPTLFISRENSHDHTKEPRRILIRGRAGVGKTTLCKKIVHNFIYEKTWGDLFARVLWVPLRALKAELPGYNLGEMFHRIYFNDQVDGKTSAETLWDAVKKTDYRYSLFILDGLDEISELLNSDHPAFSLLTELLNCPNVIITARPHARLPRAIEKYDRELETIGFNRHQVHNYIQKVVPGAENAKEIWSFLQKHQLIQSLVRIPILLDALCLIWDESFKNSPIPETMTAVYDAIVRRLWKGKDILRLHKFQAGLHDHAHDSEIQEKTEAESRLLECLAFSGMYNNVVDFQPEHRNDIRKQIKLDTKGRVFDELLGDLSFLRSSDPSGSMHQRSYHFLHLTFQEFFAAKYFVRQWEAGKELEFQDFKTRKLVKIKPDAFLGQEKYTGRYDIVWRFTVGLLQPGEVKDDDVQDNEVQDDEVRDDSVRDFFEAMEEPIDLVGPANAEESEFPDSALLSALKSGTSGQKMRIIESLRQPGRYLSEAVVAALIGVIEEKDSDSIRCDLVGDALGNQSNLSKATIAALVRLIVNEQTHEDARNAAVRGLVAQRKYSEAAIIALVSEIKEELQGQSTAAETEALGKQLNSPDPVIARLFADKHAESYTELIATEALRRQRNLSEAAVAACMCLVENTDDSHHDDALEALRRQSKLPEDTITALSRLIETRGRYDFQIVNKVADILAKQPKLPEDTITALSRLMESKCENIHTRVAATRAIGCRSFPKTLVAALLELIEDEHADGNFRLEAVMSLRHQEKLSEATIKAFVRLLENECASKEVRRQVSQVLGNQRDLPETTITALVVLFENEHESELTRYLAMNALSMQTKLSDDTITALVRLIENKCESNGIRTAANRAVQDQMEPSDDTTTALIRLIKNERENIEIPNAAIKALITPKKLSDDTITALIRLIENERESINIQSSAIRALRLQGELSDDNITALLGVIKNKNHYGFWDRFGAAEILENQTNLPEATVDALITLHQIEDLRIDTANILGRLPNLSDKIAKAVKSTLESGRISEGLDHLKCLYGSWLHHGFREQFSLYIEDGNLVFYLPSGSRMKIKAPSCEVLAAINDGRRLWVPQYSDLWPDYRMDSRAQSAQSSASD